MARRLVIALVVLALLMSAAVAAPAAGAILAGAARVDITPELPGPAKVCLGGYGARMAKPAQGVHDPVYARALVLTDGKEKVCFLALDATQPPSLLKSDLLPKLKSLGIEARGLIVGASHSHSAPDNHSESGPLISAVFGAKNPYLYDKFLQGSLAAITQANAALRPAAVGCAAAQLADMNHNRRGEQGSKQVDPALTVLRVDDREGKPMAVLFNFTAHPTIMDYDNMLISAEWPGAAETTIEQALPGTVALYFNGAEGDQSPSADKYGKAYEAVAGFGKAIAEQALAVRGQAKCSAQARLVAVSAELPLPKAEVSPAFMEITGKEYNISREVANAALGALTSKTIEQDVVVVGDLVAMSVAGEMVSDPLGLGLKEVARKAGFTCPLIVGLSPRDLCYILDKPGYIKGGYEASMSFYGPELGEMVVGGLAALVEQVKAAK